MHVPVIHENSEVEAKKWEYDLRDIDGYAEICAVDSNTEEHIATLYRTGQDGELRLATNVGITLKRFGYSTQGLQLDDKGRVKCFMC